MAAMASSGAKFDVAVKGDPVAGVLGDCPFCHRALLTFEEKGVPYDKTYINFSAKPEWLLKANPDGTVPVAKDLADGSWVVGSDVIVNLLEDRFPQPALGKAGETPDVGSGVFPAFAGFFKSTPEEAAGKEAALLAELDELEAWLVSHPGPYIGGEAPCATDCALAPKLHHMVVALGAHKAWELPAKYGGVRAYMAAMEGRPSWAATRYSDDLVIKGWGAKLPAA